MKIICVEEHITDPDLLREGRRTHQAEASYMAEVGSSFPGKIEDGDEMRPRAIRLPYLERAWSGHRQGRLAQMDQHKIDMQILSYSNPPQGTPIKSEVELTVQVDDRLAESVRANPARYGGFASLPCRHPDAAADELERAVKQLGFVGAMLLGRPGEVFLDDARFEPILSEFDELRVPLYVHPGYPLPAVQQPYYGNLDK